MRHRHPALGAAFSIEESVEVGEAGRRCAQMTGKASFSPVALKVSQCGLPTVACVSGRVDPMSSEQVCNQLSGLRASLSGFGARVALCVWQYVEIEDVLSERRLQASGAARRSKKRGRVGELRIA